jgi:hypothetical protein
VPIDPVRISEAARARARAWLQKLLGPDAERAGGPPCGEAAQKDGGVAARATPPPKEQKTPPTAAPTAEGVRHE